MSLLLAVLVVNQIRIYWWCSPPRNGRQRMCPVRSTARETGVRFATGTGRRRVKTALLTHNGHRPVIAQDPSALRRGHYKLSVPSIRKQVWTMKFAAIADVHGNCVAPEAVLA